MDEIYLDHNATTPILPEVAETVCRAYRDGYANPASQHRPGSRARRLVEDARQRIAEILGATLAGSAPDRVLFTSGGTESNNLALRGLAAGPPAHLVVSAIEHPSTMAASRRLQRAGWQLDLVAPDSAGVVPADRFAALLRPDTRAASLMLVNNETGVVQPVAEVGRACSHRGIPLHTDAVQAVGKIPLRFADLHAAALSAAAHKFHGPLGIGLLLVRGDASLEPLLVGGFQQEGLRPGTEPVPLVAGMLHALELWHSTCQARLAHLAQVRDLLESRLLAGCPDLVIHGRSAPRAPHTSCLSLPGVDRQQMLLALDLAGIACSTGSACASGSTEASPTLLAMGCADHLLASALRYSVGVSTTTAEVVEAAERILRVYNDLRSRSAARKMPSPGRSQSTIPL